jgi:Glu-tRNA(Gln) amidotransferase subunit E-like FAD-binding protein
MEKTIGFNIEVRGTEEENLKMASLKKSIFETADRLKTLRDLTKGNVEAQKEYAATIVSLETHLKAETKALNELQASQVKSSLAINNAAGSYNSLVEEILAAKPENQIKKLRRMLSESSLERMNNLFDLVK